MILLNYHWLILLHKQNNITFSMSYSSCLLITEILPLCCVTLHMVSVMLLLQDRLITMATLVRLLPSVYSHVYQDDILVESLFTIATFVWPLSWQKSLLYISN